MLSFGRHLIRSRALLLGALACACSDDGDGSGGNSQPATLCVPGQSLSCSGPGQCAGYQICNGDGSAYLPCDCDVDASTGGSGGIDGGDAGASTGGGAGVGVGGTAGVGSGGVAGTASGGTAGSASGGTAGAGSGGVAGSSGGTAGVSGGGGTGGSGTGGSGGGGTACNPVATCWVSEKVASGTLNKAFVDKNDKLYVGDGSGYYTNVSGTWVKKPLNGPKWAIDENGNPHTASYASASPPWSGLTHSELVGASWTSEPIPIVDPCPCPSACDPMSPVTFDVVVEPNGTPYVVWSTLVEFLGCGTVPQRHALRSQKVNGVWKTQYSVGKLNIGEESYVAGTAASGVLYQAGMIISGTNVGIPLVSESNQAGGNALTAVLHQTGMFSGQIALAKPAGKPLFGLLSGQDSTSGTFVPEVVLTQSYTGQPDWKATQISCPGEKGVHHALNVRPNGDASLAWVSTSGLVRYATNAGGSWVYSDLGPGQTVEVVVTSTGEVDLFLENAGDIYRMTPCL